jgi:hypothetical protein
MLSRKKIIHFSEFIVLIIFVVMAFGSFNPLSAAIITVTNINDNGPGSLRQSIVDAAPGDTISFGVTGVIRLTSGELIIDQNLKLVGPGATVLSISGDKLSRVLHIVAGNVQISNVTITDGYSNSGGGIRIDETSSLSLANSLIRNNFANIGGGIHNAGWLTMTDVIIDGNSSDLWGGGITNTGNLSAHSSTISNNTAIGGGGFLNAVYLFSNGLMQAGTAALENVTISGNTASNFGGGIVNSGTTIGSKVTYTSLVLTNCTLSNNSASTGGGLFHQFGTSTAGNTIIACQLSGGNCNSMITSLGHNLESTDT